MLQTSITKWLSKPSAVTQPDAVPLKLQPAKKPDSDNIENDNPATSPPKTVAAAVSAATATKAPRSPLSTSTHNATTTPGNSTAPTAPAPPTTLPALSPNITLAPLTASTLSSFRRLNTLLLEIPYPAKFYDEILTDPVTASITLAAFWRNTPSSTTTTTPTPNNTSPGILVAGIRCRLLSASALALPPAVPEDQHQPPRPHLYIATLSTLSPYRQHGLATHLLAAVTRAAAAAHGVAVVYAHVWVANEAGLAWYRARGFAVLRREEDYYRRLRPSGAWVVWRRVGVADMLASGGAVEGDAGVEGGA
ncbi:putative gnat family protein [Neofusicoccum parvum]|uniref:Gnat family protein n=1 Tax=Neofusicoccum parvum TaxID=310453 RepID=A0ACB5SM59_9PEZI|nr:putative gnat family protein [Neofusicoccum parvum]